MTPPVFYELRLTEVVERHAGYLSVRCAGRGRVSVTASGNEDDVHLSLTPQQARDTAAALCAAADEAEL